ncbi:uncharacterized protein C8R40DRAFT_1067358 [Lentinula edodes]|uniref:uncharacterized protein n=1 Tax=Lentinula edodes TaxID=5353 RepID=UPI001E8E5988|nr:uncharacterized protein C8R40DRAFT_1067358 [Lentinula edodes]KAH7878337.1 hypothetical protein C8R40DRAFT_1067358 [Lentinula edodes]
MVFCVGFNCTSNVVLSYLDSGSPSSSVSSYKTVFLIHGHSFSNDDGPQASATDEAKTKILELRGLEILHQKVDGDEKTRKGGLAIVGWSFGITFSLSAIANIDSSLVSNGMRDRVGQYLRAHIMLEPALTGFGLSIPPETRLAFRDPNIPYSARAPLFSHLNTGYHDYRQELWLSRTPSIYTFIAAEHDENNMVTVWAVIGDQTYSFVWPTFWEIEDDDMKAGGERRENGVNHSTHWDEPEKTMGVFRRLPDTS